MSSRITPFINRTWIRFGLRPFNATGPGEAPSRQRIFTCYPQDAAEREPCATAILRTLARRAYRRPITERDIEPMLAVYREEVDTSGFDVAIAAALQRLLVSPQFIYRIERDPAGAAPGSNYDLSGLELASRLSFFLWSSMPDDSLLAVAEQERLNDPIVLEQQVQRMLADPRADALVENFAGQWLWLRNLEAHQPSKPIFPDFDDTIRAAARRETELLLRPSCGSTGRCWSC